MRIAVYGGSFNPPHVSHGLVAAWALWTEQCDEVWLVPTFGHAFGKELAPFTERLGQCEALARVIGPQARVEAIEAELPTPSYTIDTLNTLAARWPAHSFRLLVGADTLLEKAAWHDWAGIERDFAPIIAGRQGYPGIDGVPDFPGVSSTDIRERLRDGRSVEGLIPDAVLRVLDVQGRRSPS